MLRRLKLPFTTASPNIDETPKPNETPIELALRLATEKAHAVAQNNPGKIVIGADQVATFNNLPIGKSGTFDNAMAQLKMLSGQTVSFHSAMCVTDGTRTETNNIITHCRFRKLDEAEIAAYLNAEQPYDTAGSAKAESLGIALMESMDSQDPTAIIGLPLIELSRMLRSFGINPITESQHHRPEKPNNTSTPGGLHLIPVGLGSDNTQQWLPPHVQQLAATLKIYIAENAKTARAFLKQAESKHAIRDITIHTLNKNTSDAEIQTWLKPLANQESIGLVSEAGCPAVADPGAKVVATAHKLGHTVIPHVGPSSILLGLMASGMNGQSFAFHGYAPINPKERASQIKHWENISSKQKQTQIIIETPYRNDSIFATLLQTLHENTLLCVAKSLTTPEEWIKTLSVAQWRKAKKPKLDKQPTIFLFLA